MQSPGPKRILLLMLDGVGIPPDGLDASEVLRHAPSLVRLATEHGSAIDACLGLPGTPQSATGQTSLLTGVNAAKLLGEHLQAFPNARLRRLIATRNVFTRLKARGCTCTFANAYVRGPGRDLPLTFRSVTTVATLAALGETRTRADLMAGRAVYHDITRWTVPDHGISDVPEISEETAAAHWVGIARTVDFCLFEYFLTDRMAHRGTFEDVVFTLNSLDRFLAAVVAEIDPASELLVVTSDHGNIEDPTRRGHTRNSVPLIARGRGSERMIATCKTLTDVTPAVVELLDCASGPGK